MYSECDEVAQSIFEGILRDGDIHHSIELAKHNNRGLILYVNQLLPEESHIVKDNVAESLRELLVTYKEYRT